MNRRSQAGQSLVELAISLPLAALLLCSLAAALAWGVRAYCFLLGDWETQNQLRFSMERITADLLYAYRFEEFDGRLRILVHDANETPQWVVYALTHEEMPRLTRNSQPLTGESRLVDLRVLEFEFRPVGAKTIFYRVKGENRLTGYTFELESAVTLANAETGS